MNLYSIATEYRDVVLKLLDMDLDEQTRLDTIESVSGDLEAKVTNYGYVIRQLEGEADMAEAEAKRIENMAKVRRNAVQHVKDNLLRGMQQAGITEIKAAAFTVRIRKNPPSVIINNPELLTKEWQRIKTVVEPNKESIGAALRSGNAVPGCHLEQKEQVVIK